MMKNFLKILLVVFVLSSCRDSKLDKCIEMKMDEGMSLSDAREECEEARSDSQIRR